MLQGYVGVVLECYELGPTWAVEGIQNSIAKYCEYLFSILRLRVLKGLAVKTMTSQQPEPQQPWPLCFALLCGPNLTLLTKISASLSPSPWHLQVEMVSSVSVGLGMPLLREIDSNVIKCACARGCKQDSKRAGIGKCHSEVKPEYGQLNSDSAG